MEQKNIENASIEKKVFIFSVFLLALIIIMSVSLCYFLLNNKLVNITTKNEISNDIEIPTINTSDTVTAKVEYELKEYNEKIGVFKNNALVYTIDTYVFTLPESDKQLLKKGIKVDSIEELEKLIEEYY